MMKKTHTDTTTRTTNKNPATSIITTTKTSRQTMVEMSGALNSNLKSQTVSESFALFVYLPCSVTSYHR
jgi:hypothetical protein